MTCIKWGEHESQRGLRRFEISETSSHIEEGRVTYYEVCLKTGFSGEEG